MKIISTLKNNKASTELKRSRILAANHRTVRHSGQTYQITSATIGNEVVASAALFKGNSPAINLFGKDTLAKDLKKLVENNLFS